MDERQRFERDETVAYFIVRYGDAIFAFVVVVVVAALAALV